MNAKLEKQMRAYLHLQFKNQIPYKEIVKRMKRWRKRRQDQIDKQK